MNPLHILCFCLLVACIRGQSLTSPTEVKKIGFIYFSRLSDFGWTYAHDQGRLLVQSTFDGLVETDYVADCVTDDQVYEALYSFIARGFHMLVATSFDQQFPFMKVAEVYTNVTFIIISGMTRRENVVTAFAKLEQPRYLCGLTAGLTAKGDFGYVAAFSSIPEVVRGINAFALGIRQNQPNAKVYVAFTSTWYDPFVESKVANLLLDTYPSIVAVGQHEDSTSTPEAAAARKKFSLGNNSDMRNFVGETVLTSPLFNWGSIYVPQVGAFLNGTWKSSDVWYGMEKDAVTIAPFSTKVSFENRGKVNAEKERLRNGIDEIFCGPGVQQLLRNNASCLTDEDLLTRTDLVDNVVVLGTFSREDFTKYLYVQWNSAVAVVFMVISALGIALTLFFSILFFLGRNKKIIKSSSPNFIQLSLLGCLMALISVFFWIGMPTTTLCNLRIWFGGIAFVLVFGNLLVKTWRIWWMVRMSERLNSKAIHDIHLFPLSGLLLLIELIILITWSAADQPEPRLNQTGEAEFVIQCNSKHSAIFGAVFFAYKGILMLLGAWLAYLSKDIAYNFNESKTIVVSIYNIFIVGSILIPVTIVLDLSPETRFLFVALGINLATWGPLLAICLTKVLLAFFIKKFKDSNSHANVSSANLSTYSVKS